MVLRRKKKPPTKNPATPPVGQIIAHYRSQKNLSVSGLAKLCKLGHPFVGDIERGKVKPSPEILQKIGEALELTPDHQARLEQAAKRNDPLVATGYIVNLETLLRREEMDDVLEVWIAVKRMAELDDPSEYMEYVRKTMDRDRPYVYFVTDALVWRQLHKLLVAQIGEQKVNHLVTCIEIPRVLSPFFFNPGFALYLRKGNPYVIGIVPFEGPSTSRIDCGSEMNEQTAYELYNALKDVVVDARLGKPAILSREGQHIELSVLRTPDLTRNDKTE